MSLSRFKEEPIHWQPFIAVVGASKPTDYQKTAALAAGQLIARRGALVVCGGLGGVMDAVAAGVAKAGGITVGLLPGLKVPDPTSVTIPIPTGLGQVRNVVLARACVAMIAIGGGYGTLTEIGFALRLRKPLALIDSWKFNHASMTSDPEDLPRIFVAPCLLAPGSDADAAEADAVKNATEAVEWLFNQLGR